MAGVSVDQVAVALNISPRRIQQLAKEGMPRDSRGQYELGACMAWYIRYLQHAVEQRHDPNTRDESLVLTRERSRLAREQADRQELDNAERRGELVELAAVTDAWANRLVSLRARLRAIPTKLGPQLTNITDAAVISAQIRADIDGALEELADEGTRESDENLSSPGGVKTPPRSDSKSMGRRPSKTKPRK